MKPRLLLIEDDEVIRSQMKWALTSDYEVLEAGDRPGGMTLFRRDRPLVVLLDLGLPPAPADPAEGLAALAEIRAADGQAKVIIVSGQAERANALEAIGQGAYDFLSKPVEVQELKFILSRAFHVARLEQEFRALQERVRGDSFEGMLGTSRPMQDVFAVIRKVAGTNAPVLILGESGTGKEMAALATHNLSARKDGPFIAINCGAIPENLLESELFGHEKGSFTGAHAQRQGRIEKAAGGTLFLDEIGELPANLQVKLLRFLQEQAIERVGGREKIPIDSRVIAATNVDLKKALVEGRFREDLYYRLAVVVIQVPSLRERGEDIPLLAQTFLRRFAKENGTPRTGFDPRALRALQAYPWPGNIRELENRVKRAVIMAEAPRLTATDLGLESEAARQAATTLKEARESLETTLIQAALKKHQGNISRVAAELGISRPTLYELMGKLGIERG